MKGEKTMYKLPFEEINKLFEAVSLNTALYVPVKKNDTVVYEKYSENTIYAYDELNTVKSAKDFFFPQVQDIAQFKLRGKSIEIINNEEDYESFAVFGVRACDAKSFEILDKVFLAEPADPYYKERREKGVIITAACEKPDEVCFCTAFGIKPWEPSGDVSVWISGGYIYWQANTQKGLELTGKIKDIFNACEENEIEDFKAQIKNICGKLPFGNLDLKYFKETDEKDIFSSSVWDEIYKGCLGCGTCTFVCPTCQCYDIRDFDNGKTVERFRCWDSCMYSDFTKMAHGNPRKTQKERFRQRFMHKLKYFPMNNEGIYSCVGCGRCVRSCPQKLNIVKVAEAFSHD